MTKAMRETISFELCGHEMDDGRLYVTSETLKGFHFVLGADEDPSVMTEALVPFMKAYLQAEIEKVRPAVTPQAYRQRSLNLNRTAHRLHFVAEARAAA